MNTIIPTLRYRDARTAIRFLCTAFGFQEHMVVPPEGEEVQHAQLVLNGNMIMLGSVREDAFGELMVAPPKSGPVNQSPYIVIPDLKAHYERAKAAGAKIVMPYESQDYGGDLYSAQDPEGHLWNFGSYDPWAPIDGDE